MDQRLSVGADCCLKGRYLFRPRGLTPSHHSNDPPPTNSPDEANKKGRIAAALRSIPCASSYFTPGAPAGLATGLGAGATGASGGGAGTPDFTLYASMMVLVMLLEGAA